jgi:mediator of RNA polymerase II transcription subunit 13
MIIHFALKLINIAVGRNGTFQSSDLAGPNFSNRITTTQAGSSIQDSRSIDWKPTLVEIYSSFTLAVERTISYRLLQQGNIIPIDSSTFVISDIHNPRSLSIEACLDIFHISTYLTSSGVLTFSIYSNENSSYGLQIQPIPNDIDSGKPMLLVPGLLSATYIGSSNSHFDSEHAVRWRRHVISWLQKQGLTLHMPDEPKDWILLKLGQQNADLEWYGSKEMVFLWPKGLGFVIQSSHPRIINHLLVQGSAAYPWLIDTESYMPIDPLSFAAQWSTGAVERNQKLIWRKKQETANLIKANPFPASPINIRSIVYGDTHGPAGVYPTPPDGLSSQVGTVAMSVDTPIGMNDVPVQALDFKATPTGPRLQPESKRPQVASMMKLEDDLFGDMDEDDFGGNDITDADFSFFDQDDNATNSGKLNNKSSKALKTENHNNDMEFTYLDHTLPQIDVTDTTKALVDPTTISAGEDTEMTEAKFSLSTQKANQLPRVGQYLTPAEVQRRLFSRQMTDAIKETTRNKLQNYSQYQPVMFNDSLRNSDAKYSSTGAFNFNQSKPKSAQVSKVQSSHTPHYTPFLPQNPTKINTNVDSDTSDTDSSSENDGSSDMYDNRGLVSRSNSHPRSDEAVDANVLQPPAGDLLQLDPDDLVCYLIRACLC